MCSDSTHTLNVDGQAAAYLSTRNHVSLAYANAVLSAGHAEPVKPTQ